MDTPQPTDNVYSKEEMDRRLTNIQSMMESIALITARFCREKNDNRFSSTVIAKFPLLAFHTMLSRVRPDQFDAKLEEIYVDWKKLVEQTDKEKEQPNKDDGQSTTSV